MHPGHMVVRIQPVFCLCVQSKANKKGVSWDSKIKMWHIVEQERDTEESDGKMGEDTHWY